jgi:hypothetical protein
MSFGGSEKFSGSVVGNILCVTNGDLNEWRGGMRWEQLCAGKGYSGAPLAGLIITISLEGVFIICNS